MFHIAPGRTVAISELTITNGHGSQVQGDFPANAGGGIYSDHASLTVSGCTVSSNSARYGGGIFSNGEGSSVSLTVVNSTLSGNSAQFGGGVFNDGEGGGAKVVVTRSALTGDSAGFGGRRPL